MCVCTLTYFVDKKNCMTNNEHMVCKDTDAVPIFPCSLRTNGSFLSGNHMFFMHFFGEEHVSVQQYSIFGKRKGCKRNLCFLKTTFSAGENSRPLSHPVVHPSQNTSKRRPH